MSKLNFRFMTAEETAKHQNEQEQYETQRRMALHAWRENNDSKYRPSCSAEDHTWRVEIEIGGVHVICKDPHTEEEIMQMDPNSSYPMCQMMESDLLVGVIDDVKLEGVTQSYGDGYGGVGEVDFWVEMRSGTITP